MPQFDAQVTPPADTTHEGLPWQISPPLVRTQPVLVLRGVGVLLAGGVVVEAGAGAVGEVVVVVADVVLVPLAEDVSVLDEGALVGDGVVVCGAGCAV